MKDRKVMVERKEQLKKSLNLVILFGIISVIALVKVFGETLKFEPKEIDEYTLIPDALAFHFSLVDYDIQDGEERDATLQGPMVEEGKTIMQGYGRYHMQPQFNLIQFILLCNNKFPTVVDNAIKKVVITNKTIGKKVEEMTTTEKYLETLQGRILVGNEIDIIKDIWKELSLAPEKKFDELQDSFVLQRYVLPAVKAINLTKEQYARAFVGESKKYSIENEEVRRNGEELLTVILSSVYSDFYTADLTNLSGNKIDIKAGDLVPFLYNADEVRNNLREMARYAYIAYVYGFATAGITEGNHYWEEEFRTVFPNEDESFYNLTDTEIENYQKKYDKMVEILINDKGNKGSRLLGQKIDVIIKGDYNIDTQITAVRSKIDKILEKFDKEYSYSDLITKNYLMVKHMMDNEHIKDTIKDYEVGTIFRNEAGISQGQADEENVSSVLLADFQMVKIDAKSIKEARKKGIDTDKDDVKDKDELGSDPSEWTDITEIVKAAKSIDGTNGEITKEEAIKWEQFNDSIKVEWEDASKTKVNKIKAKMYNYKSNPNLKDSDFDGFSDKEEENALPLNNNFKGSSMTTDDGKLNIDYNIDFRYLMHKDTKYNDELCQHSLIMSNLANGESIDVKQGSKSYDNLNIKEYMHKLGFECNFDNHTILDSNGYALDYYIGYKEVDYYGKKRGVIGIFLGGLKDAWAYVDLVTNKDNLDNNNKYSELAKQIMIKISDSKLIEYSKYELGCCFWISGKGIAGGVASELASELDNTNDIYCYTFGAPKTRKGGGNTLAFIKNIVNEDDYLTKVYGNEYYVNGEIYNASICADLKYNYRNLTKDINKYTGNYQKVNSIIKAVNKLRDTNDPIIKTFNKELGFLLSNCISHTSANKDMTDSFNNNVSKDATLTVVKNSSNDEFRTASSTRAYWTLAKCLEGIDKITMHKRRYEKTFEEASSEIWDNDKTAEDIEYEKNLKVLLECIKEVGNEYIDNVYTYSAGKTLSYNSLDSNGNIVENPKANDSTIKYSIEDRIAKISTTDVEVTDVVFDVGKKMKTSSISAYNVWNEYKENIIGSNIGITKDNIKSRKVMMQGADTDTTIALHHLDLFDEYVETNDKGELKFNSKRYNYDENNNRVYIGNANKRNYVADDCSGFAAAVYYHYLNKIKEEKNGDGIDLWTTGSRRFIDKDSAISKILNNNKFQIYQWDETNKVKDSNNIIKLKDFKLQSGDLLYRAPQNGKSAHVEFYLENDKKEPFSFGWGDIQSSFENNKNSKEFEIIRDVDNYNLITENIIKVETGNSNYKLKTGQNATTGDKYKVVGIPGIYNTIRSFYDYNCRYDYVIRLEKNTSSDVEVGNE